MSATPTPSEPPVAAGTRRATSAATIEFVQARRALLDDDSLFGADVVAPYVQLVDNWLIARFEEVFPGRRTDIVLVATGGYGRSDLAPRSDLDLLLLHEGEIDEELAGGFWYPLWDVGLRIGHGVRTVEETLVLGSEDLEVATSVLSTRFIAGDLALADQLEHAGRQQWTEGSARWQRVLGDSVTARHHGAAEVAFALEPDLKDGRGGLRDVHAMGWALGGAMSAAPRHLYRAFQDLLGARVELHRATGRSANVLTLQDQDAVAEGLQLSDADELMAVIAAAGRQIAWTSDELWFDIGRREVGPEAPRDLGRGLFISGGRIRIIDESVVEDPGKASPLLPLSVGLAAATEHLRLAPDTVTAIGAAPALSEPWPSEAREFFVELLLAGDLDAIEALDHAGALVALIPEWAPNRNKPQRNAYHRFTVDRHLLEAVRVAAGLAGSVKRPDLLVVGTLLHDIGKGYPGDHTIVGMELARTIATRMGFGADDVETIVTMVQFHLLIPDVATRRDLDDPATVAGVAAQVGSIERLELLGALTEADSLATGPAAWSAWKEQLVRELVLRAAHVLLGGAIRDVSTRGQPSVVTRELLDDARHLGDPLFRVVGDRLIIACPDHPGLFSRIAGVLALNGLEVLDATVYSEDGFALDEFRVVGQFDPEIPIDRIRDDLDRAITGRLSLPTLLAERAKRYPQRRVSARKLTPAVRVLNDASVDASVIEVVGPDNLGLLYRITATLTDLGLDIRTAKVTTIGPDAVDAFYVTDKMGAKVSDDRIGELCGALIHTLTDES